MSGRRVMRAAVVVGALLVGRMLSAQVSNASNSMTELDSVTARLVYATIDAARSRGLPTEPLLAKLREGRLKRAPAVRIRAAVQALSTRLDSARSALGAGATGDEIGAGADALAAGASTAALRTLGGARGTQSVTTTLGALAQLVASGVPEKRAVTMLMELMRKNFAPAQMLAFGNAVEYDVATGLPPEEAALFHLRRMDAVSAAATNAAPDNAGTALFGPHNTAFDPPYSNSTTSPPKSGSPRRRP